MNDAKTSEAKPSHPSRVKQKTNDDESFFVFRNKIMNRYRESVNSSNKKTKTEKPPNKTKQSQTILYESDITDSFMKETIATLSNCSQYVNAKHKKHNSPLVRAKSPVVTKMNCNNIKKQLSLLQNEICSITKSHYTVINTPMLTLNNNPTMNINKATITANHHSITPTNHNRQNNTETKKKLNRNCSGPNIMHSINQRLFFDDPKKEKENEIASFKKNFWY